MPFGSCGLAVFVAVREVVGATVGSCWGSVSGWYCKGDAWLPSTCHLNP